MHDIIRMKSTGTSTTKCFERMLDVGADLRFVIALPLWVGKKSKDHTFGKIMMEAK